MSDRAKCSGPVEESIDVESPRGASCMSNDDSRRMRGAEVLRGIGEVRSSRASQD